MAEFVEGIHLETKQNQWGGEYIKASIDVEKIFNNPLNKNKYLNFMIFKSKSGNWYTQLSKPQNKQEQENIVDFDEIPF